MITGARMTYSEGSGARDKDTNAHENSVNDGADTPIEELRTRLREKEDFLQSVLISSSTISIVSTNIDGIIEYWNAGAERIFGYSAGEMVGLKTMAALYPADDPEAAAGIESIRSAIYDRKESVTRVVREIGRDGRSIWLKVTASPRFSIAGEVVGILGIGEDISATMTAQQETEQSERERRLLAQTVASTHDLVSITDLHGSILFTNEAFMRAYGYDGDDLVGRAIAVTHSPAVSEVMLGSIQSATLAGGWHGEVMERRKDGSEFSADLSTSVVYDDAGSPVALVGVGHDITDRKLAEWKQSSIYAISAAAQSGNNLRQLFLTIHGIISNLLPAGNFYIALYDAAHDILSFPYFVDEYDAPPSAGPPAHGLTEYVLRTGAPLFVTPEKFDELVRAGEVEPIGAPSVHWLGVPLIAGEERLGVIAVQSYSEGIRFTNQDLSMLKFVSAQVAMTIQRRRSEERLTNSENKFRMVFETSDNAILLLLGGICVDCNPRTEYILGLQRKHIIGMALTTFSPEKQPDGRDSRDKIERGLAASLGGVVQQFEWTMRRGDGSLFPAEVSFNQLPLEGVPHVQAVLRDVSDRKRAETALRFDEARIESLLRLNQLSGATLQQLKVRALQEACRLSASGCGFLASVNPQEDSVAILARWESGRGDIPENASQTDMPIQSVGAWGEALRKHRSVIQNSYEVSIGAAEAYPVEGILISRHLSVPIFEGGRLVAVAGIANKSEDYDTADERQLMMFMDGVWLILQRVRAEEMIKESLSEKEVLLKEIHHRVKNNLQIISSLLSLQSGYVKEPDDLEIFRESQSRVKSMALIHEALYQSKDLSRVDFAQYVQSLTTHLFRSYVEKSKEVTLGLEVQNVSLGIDTAIPCGLIINELVSNALKHGFLGRNGGNITVRLNETGGHCALSVIDDGVGFPAGVRFEASETLGLQLVHTLSSQIGGAIAMENHRGTTVTITFAVPA